MAPYTPIASPPPPLLPPRIIVTEHEDTINTAANVLWQRNILTAIWIPQFFFLLLGMAFLPYEIDEVISFGTIFVGIIALGNMVLVSTPLIEAHHYATGNLTLQFFQKLQMYKAKWVAGSLVIIVLIQGGNKYKNAWSMLWIIVADVLYWSPFAAGMWYAKQMAKESGGTRHGGQDVESGTVRL